MSTSPLNFGSSGYLRGEIVLQDRTIGRDFLKYLQNLEQHIITLFSLKVSQLPLTNPVPLSGSMAYASDGRKQGEGPGAGTGVPVYFSASAWRRYSDDTPVQS
jgi:hypothetical protein